MFRRPLLLPSLLFYCWCHIHFANACASNGICGGGLCQPTPAAACNPASCQPGYSCGHYGCARNKARSALTRKDGLIVPVNEFVNRTISSKNIFGIDRFGGDESEIDGILGEKTCGGKNTLDKTTYLKLTNPNYLFRQCCEDRRLPDACLWKCHFNTYTKETLQQMFFKQDPCPIEAAADLQYCAAQGRDHRRCCKTMGIDGTLAGNKCLTFCDQEAGKVTKLDYSYLPCYDRFESMKRCFYDEIQSHMETKLRPMLQRDEKTIN